MKLLVTTDFSSNSRAAIRFAQTLAKQSDTVEVVFFHAINIIKPTQWHNSIYAGYTLEEIERLTEELKKFVYSTFTNKHLHFKKVDFLVVNCISIENEILRYAERQKMDFICIATKGAGILRKVMGTHTSYVVKNSKVPVLVIPSHYKSKPLKKATYLSDFENLKKEVSQLFSFSSEITLDLEVVHYMSILIDKKQFEDKKELFHTSSFKNVHLNLQKSDFNLSLVERISNYVEKNKPELLIMFTKREKGFFESLFLPSKSAEITYSTKVPVLIYSK